MLTIANHNFLTIKKSTMSKHLSVKCTHLHLCSLSMVFMLLFLPCMAIKATSQNLTVSGVVTSASDKMPLIGVSVLVKGTTNGIMYQKNLPTIMFPKIYQIQNRLYQMDGKIWYQKL